VKDQVYWVTYQNNLHSAYHLLSDDGAEAPVEFINHWWHFLVWKDEQGYLTNCECLIEKYQYQTRWYNEREPSPISPLEPQEPPPAYDSLPADSSSNQESAHEESDGDIEVQHGINYDDEVLAQRAELFTTREPIEPEPITLAEAMERMTQQTADYDFTLLDHEPMQISSTSAVSTALTLPAQPFQVGQPSGGNVFLQGSSGGGGGGGGGSVPRGFPGGGGGGGGGGRGGGGSGRPPMPAPTPVPATAAAAAPTPTPNNDPRSLFRSAPLIFNGSCNKSNDFMQAFDLYRTINQQHNVFANPYNHIMMCLSYMKGPKVNDWVQQRAHALQQAVDNSTVQPDDKDIWTTFHGELEAAFTDTTRHKQVTLDLISMSMKGDNLDTYMATFKHLQECAGWESDAQGTILLFQ
jgi:hypothetical protein